MDIKEEDLYLAKLLEKNAIKHDEFEDIEYKPEINAFDSKYLKQSFVDKINFGWSVWQEKTTPEGFVLLPIEPSEAIKTALSYQCFDFIKVAQVYRNLGFDIPKKAEDEQSFFLHKFLILAIKHGNDFIKVFNAETKAMIEAQEQSHD